MKSFLELLRGLNHVPKLPDVPRSFVACISGTGDVAEVNLYVKTEKGETYELQWPSGWPSEVEDVFLMERGFTIC